MSIGLLVVLAVGLAVVFQRVVRPRLRPADWNWRVRPEPLPEQIDEAHEREAWRVRYDAVWSRNTLERRCCCSAWSAPSSARCCPTTPAR
ncbi:hypothetical protein [Paractinoplanes hotanensis]|uniref:Uncharacterized protein n=1 Tax=Paractinoplanes hotanensis TaxID=2906497 RepID=A0ABT0XS87_9ACTN|nr:hypothetical protein [Actinoplanes hotanensis]MCM4076631.1 hypothetical protein [Actinoplanes hotanensis]